MVFNFLTCFEVYFSYFFNRLGSACHNLETKLFWFLSKLNGNSNRDKHFEDYQVLKFKKKKSMKSNLFISCILQGK